MSVFDILIFKKLLGKFTFNTVDSGEETGIPQGSTLSQDAPLTDDVTHSAPETTYSTVVDVTGSGFLLHFSVVKPSTTNSVIVQYKITLDGTAVATDADAHATSTSARDSVIVGQVSVVGGSTLYYALPPVFLPFNVSMKVEVKYSATPGSSENINTKHCIVYS